MPEPFAKETDGFMARHFDRKISGAVSGLLLKTAVTPNQITIAVTLLGVVSGVLMSQTGYRPKLLGASLFLLTSILDGCDGEIARAKKMTSRLGGWLDLIGDNIVHVAVFYGLGIGLYKDFWNTTYLTLGRWAAFGTMLSASLVSWRTYQNLKGGSPKTDESLFTSVVGNPGSVRGSAWQRRLIRWSDALARRDFVYAVVLLAILGKLQWFLWPCAIGANLYAVVLAALLVVTSSKS